MTLENERQLEKHCAEANAYVHSLGYAMESHASTAMSRLDKQQFEQRIRTCSRQLGSLERDVDSLTEGIRHLHSSLRELVDQFDPALLPHPADEFKPVAIANGKKLDSAEITEAERAKYNIVLDCIRGTVVVRSHRGKGTGATPYAVSAIGKRQLELLEYMLGHPDHPICVETIGAVYGPNSIMEPHTLRKTIQRLREALGDHDHTYILTDRICAAAFSSTGCAYRMNKRFSYLIIKYDLRTVTELSVHLSRRCHRSQID